MLAAGLGNLVFVLVWILFGAVIPQARAAPAGQPPAGRVITGVVALYEFEEGSGSLVLDSSGISTPLTLTILASPGDVAWISGGLAVNANVILQTTGRATKVVTACQNSNEISIEAWVKPDNTTQNGPARIVTLSVDPYNRNFTLAQEANQYIVRLRTTNTTINGFPELVSPPGSVTTNLSHILYTRNTTGTEKIYINSVAVVTGTRTGNFSNWDPGYRLALANELTNNRPWLGEYHLVAVYCRALTPAEVAQNYAAGPNGATPHLVISKSAVFSNPLQPGDTLTYTVVVSNDGRATATAAVISDSLPANTNFVSGSIRLDPPGAGVAGVAPPLLAGGLTISVGQRVTVTFAVTVSAAAVPGSTITNTAAVSSPQVPVPVSGIHTATLATFNPGLFIDKSGPATVRVDQTAVYTYIVINSSLIGDGSPVSNVVVTDSLTGPGIYVSGDYNGNSILDLNEGWVFTGTYTFQPSDPTQMNTVVIVRGKDLNGITVSASDSFLITIASDLFLPVIFK